MLDGRVALVTGGSRGIGAAVARRLARAGADVALTYLSSPGKAADVVRDIEAAGARGVALQADSASADGPVEAVEETVSRLGRLDILVNNAGVFPYGPVQNLTVEDIDHALAVHVRAALLASRAAVRHMGAGARIISIGSNLAERTPGPGLALYSAGKAALGGMTRALARELGVRDITVNLVSPGSTDTDMNPADSEVADDERDLTALGRYNDPDDVAATVVHLAGPAGRNITGSTILVDAGANA